MAPHIVLLRGVNIGPRNRVAMPELRELFVGAGFEDVQTYVQSGNVVLRSELEAEQLARQCERLIASRFGLEIPVITRTRDELAAVVERNPLAAVAVNPKRYQVTFLAAAPPAATIEKLDAARVEPEALSAIGREIYAWHPDGIARSKLWNKLAGPGLGVPATARNWSTVTTLLEMADGTGP